MTFLDWLIIILVVFALFGGSMLSREREHKKERDPEPMNVAKDDASLNVAHPFDAEHED